MQTGELINHKHQTDLPFGHLLEGENIDQRKADRQISKMAISCFK